MDFKSCMAAVARFGKELEAFQWSVKVGDAAFAVRLQQLQEFTGSLGERVVEDIVPDYEGVDAVMAQLPTVSDDIIEFNQGKVDEPVVDEEHEAEPDARSQALQTIESLSGDEGSSRVDDDVHEKERSFETERVPARPWDRLGLLSIYNESVFVASNPVTHQDEAVMTDSVEGIHEDESKLMEEPSLLKPVHSQDSVEIITESKLDGCDGVVAESDVASDERDRTKVTVDNVESDVEGGGLESRFPRSVDSIVEQEADNYNHWTPGRSGYACVEPLVEVLQEHYDDIFHQRPFKAGTAGIVKASVPSMLFGQHSQFKHRLRSRQ